ncbi:phosphogluconate dehydratase [Croceicoccus sp. F390]|uniref:Phosphogluconate dehydratase n=1 Tax=Croceicoccus esteveae TaxID=3075597 RepID=A0ABU2ZH62_9SPHN|nr:phosphogluconate dehydratase [Croceicoccus sp. F390]MDT0575403.1 phosphogluconate dehydratase [Croceicoccus sp. F390]
MAELHPAIARVTDRIIEKSRASRSRYVALMERESGRTPDRRQIACSNLAHAIAASGNDKAAIADPQTPNLAIVTAYNDMLSAHQPYGRYPEQMKLFAREVGATMQVAGGTPAMCDGVTQGQDGMELSLFSRDAIAMAGAVALSHEVFDGMAMLGICDKIVPGLLIAALRFGHMGCVFIPSGPMPSGISNKEKQKTRQLYAEGKVDRDALLDSENASYHAPGTCTFFGTANSNQMMMEMMGLHMPGAAFVAPNTALRTQLTRAAVHRLAQISQRGSDPRPLYRCVDEKAVVNAIVGLMATGGSTNHALHIPAFARAAGIIVDWSDMEEISHTVPLLARIYPNGSGDVNHFHAAGGMGYVIRELLDAGLAHDDILTIGGQSLRDQAAEPVLDDEVLTWRQPPERSGDDAMLRPVREPFQNDGGMRLLSGNLGRATIKISAVAPEHWTIEAPCRVFDTQRAVADAFKAGDLEQDTVVVVRFQGPRANGMPELHKLTPVLGILQDRGFKVALVTDGRMSGASGKVPAAIHCTPEAKDGGPLSRLRDGDVIRVDAVTGVLSTTADLASRTPAEAPPPSEGVGREIFSIMRAGADGAEQGASAMLSAAGL